MNQPTSPKGTADASQSVRSAKNVTTPRPPGLLRKSNPNDLLKNLKSVDKKQQKKPTILEQANQDWNRCKEVEQLEDELKQATKSKTGYIDRQLFLQRSDLRQFEKEREIRDRTRASRQLH